MTLAFIALGSNLGDREAALSYGRARLEDFGALEAVSSLYETEPVGGPPQGAFLNQVVALETALDADALLAEMLAVERERGRDRTKQPPNGPRTLDLDLLLFGDAVRKSAALTLPHPRLAERRFVLVPLAEIAPDRVHPTLKKSIARLLRTCPDGSRVERYAETGGS